MRKLYIYLAVFLLLLSLKQANAVTVVINTGSPGVPEYNVGPVYMSATLFYRASRWSYLYTQSELTAAGITSGSVITDLGWMKNNAAASLVGGKFRIYMKNSSAASYANATETWTNLNAGTSLNYENLNQLIPATASPAYINFPLNTSFTYTGGSVEIMVEWDATSTTAALATGSFDWVWSTVVDRIYGNGGSTLSNSLSSTFNNVTMDNRRPFIQITYNSGTPTVPACVTAPTAPANAASICAGATTLSWPAVTGATGYDVYLNTGATATTVVSANQTGTTYNATVAAGTYAWKVVPKNAAGDATGCATFNFTVNPAVTPTISIAASPSGTICAGTPVTFTATATNGGAAPTFQWKKGTTNVGTSSTTYTDNTLITGNAISVVMTGNAACASAATVTSNVITATVSPRPTASVTPSGTASVCTGSTVTLNANTGTGLTYRWQRNSADIAGATTATYTASTTGTYRVLVSNGTCEDTSAVTTVNILPKPVATVSPSGAAAFCQGRSVLLSGPAPATGVTYQWQINGGNIAGATSNTYAASAQGAYRVVLSNGSCGDTSSVVNITVNPVPVAAATAGGPTTFCTGGSVTLTANAGTGLSYSWLRNTALIAGATTNTYTANTSGVYAVIVANTTTGCSDTLDPGIPVLVSAVPSATLTVVGSLTFCAGATVRLQAAVGTGFTYVWYKDNIVIAGATTSSYTTGLAGVYHAVITNNGCVTTTATRTVVVNPLPVATAAAGGATSFCVGGSVVLSANTGTGLTYQWQLNTINIPGATSPAYTANASGSYTVLVSNGTCNNLSTPVAVTVSTMPSAAVNVVGSPTFCMGGSVSLEATAGTGYTYQWQRNGVAIAGATASSLTAVATGDYTVVITNGACVATSAPFTVSVTPAPVAIIVPASATVFCQGGNVVLNASRGMAYSYQWTLNTSDIPGATAYNYTTASSGNYGVRIFDGNCSSTAPDVTVAVNPFPVAIVTVANGNELSTTVFANYQWYRNGVAIPGATAQNYTAVRDGYYAVLVTDGIGCSATSAVQLITSLDIDQKTVGVPVRLWPNPVDQELHIESVRPVNIALTAVDGKLLLRAEQATTINISHLPQGLYLVRISDAVTGALIKVDKINKK